MGDRGVELLESIQSKVAIHISLLTHNSLCSINGPTVGRWQNTDCCYSVGEERMTGDGGSCRQRFPVCVHVFKGQCRLAGWLDAHTNPQLLLSDAKDHLGVRTCRGGAGKWFILRSSGLRWSQRKQLQWRWYIPSVCMWLREGWGQKKKKYRAGTWAQSVCMQGLWFLSWGKRRWYNTERSRSIVRCLWSRCWNIITLL